VLVEISDVGLEERFLCLVQRLLVLNEVEQTVLKLFKSCPAVIRAQRWILVTRGVGASSNDNSPVISSELGVLDFNWLFKIKRIQQTGGGAGVFVGYEDYGDCGTQCAFTKKENYH
ncbi:hypothetical protein Tco_1426170, partial [Tanacetum coccineum]